MQSYKLVLLWYDLWSLIITSIQNIGAKSCRSHRLCNWVTFHRWCNENDSIWGCRCYGDWRHRVQHWCIVNCRILQVNCDQRLVSSVGVNHHSKSFPVSFWYFKSNIETCRSRALTTKYNSSPQEASRPFDSGRDGFVWV